MTYVQKADAKFEVPTSPFEGYGLRRTSLNGAEAFDLGERAFNRFQSLYAAKTGKTKPVLWHNVKHEWAGIVRAFSDDHILVLLTAWFEDPRPSYEHPRFLAQVGRLHETVVGRVSDGKHRAGLRMATSQLPTMAARLERVREIQDEWDEARGREKRDWCKPKTEPGPVDKEEQLRRLDESMANRQTAKPVYGPKDWWQD